MMGQQVEPLGFARAWAPRRRSVAPANAGTQTPGRGVALIESLEEIAARLEDRIGSSLADGTSASEVRSLLVEFLDDRKLWSDFTEMSKALSSDAVRKRAADPTYQSIFRLVESLPATAADRAEKLTRAELSLFADPRFQEKLLATVKGAISMGMRPCSTPGEFLEQPSIHPLLRKAFLGARVADLAIVGIGASRRYQYAPGVSEALLTEYVRGLERNYTWLVILARWFEVEIPDENLALLTDVPLDFAKILGETQIAWEGQRRFREEARRAGLPAYPPMRPEDDAADAEDA